ncbi:hypothetical protein KIPB_009392 [Kipferlia bialata]|uniref:Tc1-like transposase DDE domain-containing protein n=1 Tax=Kipferlia bialata TaxID=797122 RepID=A0A9K3D332_9EUKA|nr:hypothetical protein KIPB_009392 [Kipferlia bialata]|eukprot:g9392.t1
MGQGQSTEATRTFRPSGGVLDAILLPQVADEAVIVTKVGGVGGTPGVGVVMRSHSKSISVAVGCDDGSIMVFNPATGKLMMELPCKAKSSTKDGHSAPVTCLCAYNAGTESQLLSGSADGTVIHWSLSKGVCDTVYTASGPVSDVLYIPGLQIFFDAVNGAVMEMGERPVADHATLQWGMLGDTGTAIYDGKYTRVHTQDEPVWISRGSLLQYALLCRYVYQQVGKGSESIRKLLRLQSLAGGKLSGTSFGYIDQLHVDTRVFNVEKGYSKVGKRCYDRKHQTRGRVRISANGVLTTKGIRYDLCWGTTNRTKFLYGICLMMLELAHPFPGPCSVWVSDNASIAKCKELGALAKAFGCYLVYLPPYSPW